MQQFFENGIYPALLVVSGVLVLAGALTMLLPRLHRRLQQIVTGYWILTPIAVILGLLVSVTNGGPIVLSISYLICTLITLPLLGISRIGAPDADNGDPNRPILSARQMAQVDGAVAMLVGVAAAVLWWRITVIWGG